MMLKEDDNNEMMNEIQILFKINHENILRFFDFFEENIDYEPSICIITEFCEVFWF